jgi:hypothetical protein
MPELEKSEAEYHQKICRTFATRQTQYEQAKETLKNAEREYIEAIGAHNSWFQHLATKYDLSENDRISEDGEIIKGSES